jgi:ribonuclease VapC
VGDAFVLDASALLCLLNAEPGAGRVAEALSRCVVSAVNLSEAIAKLAERGGAKARIEAAIGGLQLPIAAFDEEQAWLAGLLRPKTRHAGLSLGDRACLALGQSRNAIVLTCDSLWLNLDLGVAIESLR